jgi:hypothetical protein
MNFRSLSMSKPNLHPLARELSTSIHDRRTSFGVPPQKTFSIGTFKWGVYVVRPFFWYTFPLALCKHHLLQILHIATRLGRTIRQVSLLSFKRYFSDAHLMPQTRVPTMTYNGLILIAFGPYGTEVQPISIVTALAGGAPACPNTVATPKHQFYASCIAILTFFSVFSCQLSLYNGSCVKSSSALARAFFRACPSPSYSPA